MKLTLKWSNTKGEGYADAKEAAALMEDPDITTLDFLRDCITDLIELYDAAIDRHAQVAATKLPPQTTSNALH
jgi:hypothetical protein